MWDLSGQNVRGLYLDAFEVSGQVVRSRVSYGGQVQHTVVLDRPLHIYGADRDRVILDQDQVRQVASNRKLSWD